ncbi:hypothetical protein [Halocella sp. SP3-1]|uniref:hypothetical protein n=1 Tax=Halocella sp. SP3-1 TaxID=2382161 RepID=UPI00197ACD01|nr:hypothetical protein [Halocella sp. SP3-1]
MIKLDMNAIQRKKFEELDLNNEFFDSLKADYPGFEKWFLRKAEDEQSAYVLEDNGLQGFLYLKEEKEEDSSITPHFELKRRLKVGTFKVNAHGTKVGDRFIKLIIDEMYRKKYESLCDNIRQT